MLSRILIATVRGYQLLVSSWTLPSCRFAPTCSAYAIEAIERHGSLRGSWIALRRIGRCHPWGGHGYDPVPPRSMENFGAAGTRVVSGAEESGTADRMRTTRMDVG